MVVHSASRFMQRIGRKQTRLKLHHSNYVCFDAYKAKYVHRTILDFYGSEVYQNYMFSLWATPRVWMPQQVTYRTYLEYVVALYIFTGD